MTVATANLPLATTPRSKEKTPPQQGSSAIMMTPQETYFPLASATTASSKENSVASQEAIEVTKDIPFFSRAHQIFRPLQGCFQKKQVDDLDDGMIMATKNKISTTKPTMSSVKQNNDNMIIKDQAPVEKLLVPPMIFSYTAPRRAEAGLRDDHRDDMESLTSDITLPQPLFLKGSCPVDLDDNIEDNEEETLMLFSDQCVSPDHFASERTWPEDETSQNSGITPPPSPREQPSPIQQARSDPETIPMTKITSTDAVQRSSSAKNKSRHDDGDEEGSLLKTMPFLTPPTSSDPSTENTATRVHAIRISMLIEGGLQTVIYSGDININGLPHGHGVIKFPSGDIYLGDMKEGRMNGHGTLVFADHDFVTGDFENNMYVI
jgi:hypothetical protein